MDKQSVARPLRARTPKAEPPRLTRLYACSGCGERFPRRELIELTEDNHDNLTYFHGDELCRECADNSGVCY